MTNYTQEMPPPGGFGEINYRAVPTKRWLSNKKLAVGVIAFVSYNAYMNRFVRRAILRDEVSEYDAKIALEPFLEAERDRNFLVQLWKNRQMEEKIMKDVPGWQIGTFYGIPFFKTFDEDKLTPECISSFNLFSHNQYSRYADPAKQGLSEWRLN